MNKPMNERKYSWPRDISGESVVAWSAYERFWHAYLPLKKLMATSSFKESERIKLVISYLNCLMLDHHCFLFFPKFGPKKLIQIDIFWSMTPRCDRCCRNLNRRHELLTEMCAPVKTVVVHNFQVTDIPSLWTAIAWLRHFHSQPLLPVPTAILQIMTKWNYTKIEMYYMHGTFGYPFSRFPMLAIRTNLTSVQSTFATFRSYNCRNAAILTSSY